MLRQKVVTGGIILVARTVLSIVISVVGSIFILRIFDLETYGRYALSIYWIGFFAGYVNFGINTYLVRTQEKITDKLIGTAFTLFLILGLIGTASIIGLLGPLLSLFYKETKIYLILCLLSISYILGSLGNVPLSLLERDLDYKKLGFIEISSQLFYYIPAVVGALMGFGIYALVIAELSKALFSSIMACLFKNIKLRLRWDTKLNSNMLKYGFGITTSGGIFGINGALVPILVGKIAGTEAVGIIRVTQNIVGQLSLLRSIAWRISIPALGRIQNEAQKVIRVVIEGSLYQSFLVVLPLFGFMTIGYWLVPLLYGGKWEPVSAVLVLACLPVAVNAVFSLQASALFAIGKNFDEAKFTTIYTLFLWPIAYFTVSRFGYVGLPLAEVLVIPSYYVQHRMFKKSFGRPEYENIFLVLAISYISAVTGWLINIPWMSLMVFTLPTFIVMSTNKKTAHLFLSLFYHIKTAAVKQGLFPLE